MSRVRHRAVRSAGVVLVGLIVVLVGSLSAAADTAPQPLPFAQNWSNTGLITTDDQWSGVPGVIGYRGDGLASAGTNPQTVTQDGSATPIDVNANRTAVSFTTGGITEFELANPVVALQGSATADAPHLVVTVNTTGVGSVSVSYNLRDIDDTADNAVQQVALQYRVGSTGLYTNVPGGYVADATTGPSQGVLVTPVNAALPPDASNQPEVQIRVITADAAGSDEWVGVDDILITGGPPADAAPFVLATNPPNGSINVDRNGNIAITFSEPVTAGAGSFDIVCNGSVVPFSLTSDPGGTMYTLDPSAPLPEGSNCTVTVRAAGVSDQDTNDPPNNMAADYTFTFTTEGFRVRIHEIQDSSHLSPYAAKAVSQVPGIVTARRFNGFYMQDSLPDSLDQTSEGIFVFTNSAPPALAAVGASVAVSGLVSEFRGGCTPCGPGDSAYANLTITEIVTPLVMPGTEVGTIAPTVVGQAGRIPPSVIIEDDAAGDVETANGEFDVAEDGIDFYESLEGMLVRVNEPVAVGPLRIFNAGRINENRELPVLADNGAGASVRTPRGGIIVRSLDADATQDYREGDFNPERIILSDAGDPRFPPMDVSDRFTPHVDAIVDYSFANYKFIVLNEPDRVDGGLEREVADEPHRNELAVATLNVENLDGRDSQERYERIAREIDENLRLPDLLGVEEIQDNDGPPVGPSNAELTWTRLIDTIEAQSGVRYDYRQINPVPCTDQTPETSDENPDGGEPCGNIRVGFLFRTDRGLAFIDRPGGTAVTSNEVVAGRRGPQLLYSPGRIDPTNAAFVSSRKPLAGEFEWRGRKLFVIANHFNSKGGDDPLFGRFQPPQRRSEVQRHQQATIVRDFVRRIFAVDDKANVIVLGDLNDFWFSDTLEILESAPLVNLARLLPLNERYSYVFDGNSQSLDHILVAEHLTRGADRKRFDYVHVNSEFADQVSDHDPPLARLLLGGIGGK